MSNQRGMTLLEVMLAMAILAGAGLALIRNGGQQVHHLSRLEQQQFATWLADSQMHILQQQPEKTASHWQQQQGELAGERWYWRWRALATSVPQMRTLELEIRQHDDQGDPLLTLISWQKAR